MNLSTNSSQFDSLPLSSEERIYYPQWFKTLDVTNRGFLTGLEAANFLKKSKLNDQILSQIWRMVDQDNSGTLKAFGFMKSMRLIAALQQNQPLDLSQADKPAHPLPQLEGFEIQYIPPNSITADPFAINPEDTKRQQDLFLKLNPKNGLLDAVSARNIFLKSKLPDEVLSQIWNLVDTKKRGALNINEFTLAMCLIQKKLNGSLIAIPSVLPPNLSAQLSLDSIAPLPISTPPITSNEWIISKEDKLKFEGFFNNLDIQKKGFLTGEECAPFFMKSNLPEQVLSTIWNLGNFDHSNRVDKEKFSVIMFLIQKKLAGAQLPSVLPPSLLPNTTFGGTMKHSLSASSSLAIYPTLTGSTSLGMSTLPNISNFSMPVSNHTSIISEKAGFGLNSLELQEKQLMEKQKEALLLQSQVEQISSNMSEMQTKKLSMQKDFEVLEKEIFTLEAKQKEIRQQRDQEVNQVREMQSKYLQDQQKLQDLKTKIELEERDLAQMKQKSEEGKQWVQKQADLLVEQEKILQNFQSQKETIMSEFLNKKQEYEKYAVQSENVQKETEALQNELKQVLEETRKLSERNALLKEKYNQQIKEKQVMQQQLQEKKIQLQKEEQNTPKPPAEQPHLQVEGQKAELFSWDVSSIKSVKSDSAAMIAKPSTTLFDLNQSLSAPAAPPPSKSAGQTPASQSDFFEFASQPQQTVSSNTEDFFSATSSNNPHEFPSKPARSRPQSVMTSPVEQQSPSKKPDDKTPTSPQKPGQESNSPNKPAETFEEFSNKFPPLDTFEQGFQGNDRKQESPKQKSPFDDLTQDFGKSLEPQAQPAEKSVQEDDFEEDFGPFHDFFKLNKQQQQQPTSAASMTSNIENPFEQRIKAETSPTPAKVEEPFDFASAFQPAALNNSAPQQQNEMEDLFGQKKSSNAPHAEFDFFNAASAIPQANTSTDFFSAATAIQPPSNPSAGQDFFAEAAKGQQSSEAVEEIKAMGFTEEQAVLALQQTNQNVQQAIQLILDQGEVKTPSSPSAKHKQTIQHRREDSQGSSNKSGTDKKKKGLFGFLKKKKDDTTGNSSTGEL